MLPSCRVGNLMQKDRMQFLAIQRVGILDRREADVTTAAEVDIKEGEQLDNTEAEEEPEDAANEQTSNQQKKS